MVMKAGELWHCTNPDCHCVVLVKTAGEIEGENARCACGSLMKKEYTPPFVSYLQFLRDEELAEKPAPPRKE